MGKPEATTQRFRRKAKGPVLSSSTGEQISNSSVSASSMANNLLCNDLLDSNITSETAAPSLEQTPQLSHDLPAANGACAVESTDRDVKENSASLIGDNRLVAADPAPRGDRDKLKDFSAHLPAEFSGLCHSDISPLASNQSLDVCACHVQKEDSLALVVFMYNSSDDDIPHILLELRSDELEVQ